MATYNKFDIFPEHLALGAHAWDSDTFKVALTNVPPNKSHISYDPLVTYPPANSSGTDYPLGGGVTTVTASTLNGAFIVRGTECVFTAVDADIGPFKYAILYNATSWKQNAPIAWWNYDGSLIIRRGTPFSVKFNNETPGQIFRLG